MRSLISILKEAGFPLLAGFLFILSSPLYAQQHIIVNKDNTRPETGSQAISAFVTSLETTRHNGYNEIQWFAVEKDASHKFFIEYSLDGINFLSAGQVLSNTGIYNHKHYIRDARPLFYRVRIEGSAGKSTYSNPIFIDGIGIAPVQIYTTMIQGNIVNANAQLPVEKVTIVSVNGTQVFTKDINGSKDFIPIAIPSLGRGFYFITFYGNGWKSTSRFFYQS